MTGQGIHPAHCCQDCSRGAGPSSLVGLPPAGMQTAGNPSRAITSSTTIPYPALPTSSTASPTLPHKRLFASRKRSLTNYLTAMASAAFSYALGLHLPCVYAGTSSVQRRVKSDLAGRMQEDRLAQISLGKLIERRREYMRRAPQGAVQPVFDIGVTPPKTCEPMNITFNTAGGTPPYTVYIGVENWFATTVSIPASYADKEVTTWLYQHNLPFYGARPGFSNTPNVIVTVGDSSGRLLNSSAFQRVQQENTNCAPATGDLHFTFYTENSTSSVCSNVGVYWQPYSNTSTYTAPLSLFLLPAQQPPISIPVPNATAGTLNYTLAIQPGSYFVFTMTDATGSGGVGGINLAGIDEYVGQACLSQTAALPHGMPTATSQLGAEVRMPDFSGVVSSLVTSGGVVSTATSVEVVRHGSIAGNDFGTGQIAGLAIGIAIAAALAAAMITWCVWRKRHGRHTVFWDIPRGADGNLSKSSLSTPIDRRFLKSVGTRQASSNASMTAPMLSLSPQSDASDERERRLARSDSSFIDSHYDPQGNGTFSSRYGGNGSGSGWGSLPFDGNTQANNRYSSVPNVDNPATDPPPSTNSPSASAAFMNRRASSGSSHTGGAVNGNPFVNSGSHIPSSSARSYRPRSMDADEASSGSGSEFYESLPMIETRLLGNSSSMGQDRNSTGGAGTSLSSPRRPLATQLAPTRNRASYTQGSSTVPRMPSILQHSDAGLLMDDSLDDEDLMGRIELPPSYHQIQRPGHRDPMSGPASPTHAGERQRDSTLDELDLGASNTMQTARSGMTEEDESEFWRTPATDH